MAGDIHDGLITGSALSQFRDQRMAAIVPAACDLGILAQVPPSGLQRRYRPRRVVWTRSTKGEDVPAGSDLTKLARVPPSILLDGLKQVSFILISVVLCGKRRSSLRS